MMKIERTANQKTSNVRELQMSFWFLFQRFGQRFASFRTHMEAQMHWHLAELDLSFKTRCVGLLYDENWVKGEPKDLQGLQMSFWFAFFFTSYFSSRRCALCVLLPLLLKYALTKSSTSVISYFWWTCIFCLVESEKWSKIKELSTIQVSKHLPMLKNATC